MDKKYTIDNAENIVVKNGKTVKVGEVLAVVKKKELQSELNNISNRIIQWNQSYIG